LPLEIRDLLLLLFKLFAEPLILLLQSFNFARLAIGQVARTFARGQPLLSTSRH
jgi:hypothetical protein